MKIAVNNEDKQEDHIEVTDKRKQKSSKHRS